MHSTSTGPSHSERCSGLPCMRWPLQRLQQLRVVPRTRPIRPTPRRGAAGRPEQRRRSGSSARPRWSRAGSSVLYTPAQVRSLTPIRQTVETRAAEQPDLRDVFLCHAWDDRQGPAKELHDLLVARGVKVWFSEKDLGLGVPMMRAIDKGLANSRIGLVLVTPALLAPPPKRERRRQRAFGTPGGQPARSHRAQHDV